MRKLAVILGMMVLILTACGDDPPPTQIVLVVTATPEHTQTPGTPVNVTTATPTAEVTATTRPSTNTPAPATKTPEPTKPNVTPLPTATAQPPLFPTNVVAQVQLAEEVFEHGRMFWVRHTRQIWVMVDTSDDPDAPGGDWYCYNDTFQEGDAEVDPSLIPPEGMLQPRRGFGLLWRTHTELHDGLGWAITPEFELTSSYVYIAGGYVENGVYFPAAGEHRLTTLYNENISFFESDIRGDCQGGTWRMTQ
ncbi:MAG: hypothetical protein HY866_00320 [Chloroflexi bacterium]|nr:hypothetical protein [Chloroflexota bacterium]